VHFTKYGAAKKGHEGGTERRLCSRRGAGKSG
jgi:hypothetical protein